MIIYNYLAYPGVRILPNIRIDSTLFIGNRAGLHASSESARGGALAAVNSRSVGIIESVWQDNYATLDQGIVSGGAIYLQDSQAQITKGLFSGNYAEGGSAPNGFVLNYGGAIACRGTAPSISSGILSANMVHFRENIGGCGGAIGAVGPREAESIPAEQGNLVGGTMVDVSSCQFMANKANVYVGGAVYAAGILTTAKVDHCRFESNQTTAANNEGDGGAIATTGLATLRVLRGSVFNDNAAQDSGGAIYLTSMAKAEIRDSEFNRNRAVAADTTLGLGGAIHASVVSEVKLSGNTFSGNIAGGLGGGAVNVRNGGLRLIGPNRFTGNKVSRGNGGAIRVHTEDPWSIPDIAIWQRGVLQALLYGEFTTGGSIDNFSANEASQYGGAISIECPNMVILHWFKVNVNTCLVKSNIASTPIGGMTPAGIFFDNRYVLGPWGFINWRIRDCLLTNHRATSNSHMRVAVYSKTPIYARYELSSLTFSDNDGCLHFDNSPHSIGSGTVNATGLNIHSPHDRTGFGVTAKHSSSKLQFKRTNFFGYPHGIASGNAFVVFNPGSSEVDAKNNYWGDRSGPYHPTKNPGGLGGSVSDGVNFKNYRREAW